MDKRDLKAFCSVGLIMMSLISSMLLPSTVDAMAPNFFSNIPKNVPPIGKREILTSTKGIDERLRSATSQRMVETLNRVMPIIDTDEDGLLSAEEFAQVPLVSMALQTGWAAILVPRGQRHINIMNLY